MEAGKQLNQYRILRRIGAGGMAEVFVAKSIGLAGFERTVAIKTILAHGAQKDSISLFLDEARVASVLQHAAIVQTLDLGYEDETLFIVMEYVNGPALSRVIFELKQRSRFLPAHVVAYVGAKIANSLDFAHRRATDGAGNPLHLVHRDVSPQNILITRSGLVKLTDFGVARASIQTHKTKTGQVRGKAAYMAPEQVRAHALDGRTDMFALGLVLYEALTGVRPYQRKTEINSMRAILNEEVPPIHEANPDVPHDLWKVIQRTLMKKPADRYAHCGELEAELARTYRKHRESAIEEEIQALMVELFGEENEGHTPNADGKVEAWQPTISIGKDGEVSAAVPSKIPGRSLSPDIAELLKQVPGSGSLTPRSGSSPALQGGGATPATGLQPPPVSLRGASMSPVGTMPGGSVLPGTGSQPGMIPQSLVPGGYSQVAADGGALSPPASLTGGTISPAMMSHPGFPVTQNGLAAAPSSTYPTGMRMVGDGKVKVVAFAAIGVALLLAGAAGFALVTGGTETVSPVTVIPDQPSPEPTLGVQPSHEEENGQPPSAPKQEEAAAAPHPAQPATPQPPSAQQQQHAAAVAAERARQKALAAKAKGSKPEPEGAPAAAPEPAPQPKEISVAAVLGLKARSKGTDLESRLGDLANRLLAGGAPSKQDFELVEEAKRKLQ